MRGLFIVWRLLIAGEYGERKHIIKYYKKIL
jgi:hypothetical protein